MTTLNHLGKWVDSETPITGVHSIHDLNWDAYDYMDEVCLDCEKASKEYLEYREEHPEYTRDDEYSDALDGESFIECDSSHTKLMGDWEQDEEGQWDINKEGSEGYSALMRDDVIQVIWSKDTERHGLCSPCYLGQADVDSEGEFLCYVLPSDLRYKGE